MVFEKTKAFLLDESNIYPLLAVTFDTGYVILDKGTTHRYRYEWAQINFIYCSTLQSNELQDLYHRDVIDCDHGGVRHVDCILSWNEPSGRWEITTSDGLEVFDISECSNIDLKGNEFVPGGDYLSWR